MQYFYYLCGGFMDKKRIYHIIEWVVALAACAWLVYKMAVYDDYAGLWAAVSGMQMPQIVALLLCVALMPVNMSLEAWRWKTLVPMSWREAHRQVYYSKLAGLITPWRLGEYPARGLLMTGDSQESVWPKVLSMGAVGSATMTMAIVVAGVGGLGILGVLGKPGTIAHDSSAIQTYYILVGAALIALVIILALAPRLLRRWAEVNHHLMLRSTGQSLVRLACWCVQLGLVLYSLGAIGGLGTPEALGGCAVYYLLVTVTPNVPIAEVGVRGAWAIVVFGTMNAALAGVLLWGINTLLPCLAWFFLKKK